MITVTSAIALARMAGAWLVSTKAGRITLAGLAVLVFLWVYGERREADGRREVIEQIEQRDQRAVERAHEAERDIRSRGDSDVLRSLRDGTF